MSRDQQQPSKNYTPSAAIGRVRWMAPPVLTGSILGPPIVYETGVFRSPLLPTPTQQTPGYPQRFRLILPKVPDNDQTSTPPVQKRPRLEEPNESQSASSSSDKGGINVQQTVQSMTYAQYMCRQLKEKLRPSNGSVTRQEEQFQSSSTPVAEVPPSTTIINDETKPRCPTCPLQTQERIRLHGVIVTMRSHISALTEERSRLFEEVKTGKQYKTEWAQECLPYQREAKKLNAQLVLTTRERDDLLATMETERANAKSIAAELDEERAKSVALATELESIKTIIDQSDNDDRRMDSQLQIAEDAGIEKADKNQQQSDEQRGQIETKDMRLEQQIVEDAGIVMTQEISTEAIDEKPKESTTSIDDQQTPAPTEESQDSSSNAVIRQLEHKKSDEGQSQIELIENLRKSNMKLRKTNDELRRMKEDAELRMLNLDEIIQGYTERNVQLQERIRTVESQQKSQRNYQNICTRLLHLMDKYQKNIGQFALRYGDPPEFRAQLEACLQRVMEQFMSEAAQVHNSELSK